MIQKKQSRKTSRVILIAALVVLLLAAAVVGLLVWRSRMADRRETLRRVQAEAAAEAAQYEAYDPFARMVNHTADIALTVTENGELVGSYTLARLGVYEDTLTQIELAFNETERMIPSVFAQLPYEEKLAAVCQVRSPSVGLALEQLDLSPVFADLERVQRTPPRDAFISFADGAYQVVPEQYGNQLQTQTVAAALTEALRAVTVDPEALHRVEFELTDCDCYCLPAQTVESAQFDFAELLQEDLADMRLSVELLGAVEQLDPSQYLSVGTDGALIVDEALLTAQIDDWVQRYDRDETPFVLDSYVDGPVELQFLPVSYHLEAGQLQTRLREQLMSLQSAELAAPYLCTRNGEPFVLGDTYVEVDVQNQVMTYFKEGKVLVSTDVVTGASWRSPTPEGLYQVDNMTTGAWLYGEDYAVYVEYWVGFIGFWYGLHDASWRTQFGADNYILNGSHGCVNTPEEPMAKIYEHIELGVPVIVHGPYYN